MRHSLLSDLGFFLVFLLVIVTPCTSAADFLRQNTKIALDKGNFLVFEDVERVEDAKHIAFGKYILLHVTRDGKTIRVTGLEDLKKPESIKVSVTPSAPKPPRIN